MTWKVYGLIATLSVASLGAAGRDVRLATAAEHRDTKAALALIKQGADVGAPQADGATALHWAAHWNDVALAKALTAAGADPTATNDYGVTPLFLAATNGSSEMIDVLLGAKANANDALPTGETVLMEAVRGGNLQVVKRLLAAGAKPNASQASKGQTALMWAATAQQVDIAKALIEGGADVHAASTAGFTPLLFAAREGGIDMVRYLLSVGADVNEHSKDGTTTLLAATVRGYAKLAIFVLDQGAKPDGDLSTAGYAPLHWAAARFDDVLQPVNNQSINEWSPLMGIPDRSDKIALIRKLLDKGADVNARAAKGLPATFGDHHATATPLLVAAGSGDAEVMQLLLQKGADPLARGGGGDPMRGSSPGGATAIMVACGGNVDTSVVISEAQRIEAIKLAIKAGVDVNAADEKGYRAMHVAASNGYHGIIKVLLENGADLNAVTNSRVERDYGNGILEVEGQSPLGIVEGTFTGGIIRERPETAAFLRSLGAKSVGKATLDTYIQSFENYKKKKDAERSGSKAEGDTSKPAAASAR
jgi:ankyrin repeat protein